MQQVRPPPSETYHPPLAPSIPLSAINTLIPRLTTTINDIDSLKDLLGSGAQDGSLPSWDTLLQRYSLLLGRINALSNYLSPSPSTLPTASSSKPPPSIPPLSQYLVHPLNPLPTSSSEGEVISPLAPETFFQVINTLPLPLTTSSISSEGGAAEAEDGAKGEGGEWHNPDQLRTMDEPTLEILRRGLKSRLERESRKAGVLLEEIGRREEEVDWVMRVDADDEEDDDEDEGEGGQKGAGVEAGPRGGEESAVVEQKGVDPAKDEKKDDEDDDDDDNDDDLFGGDDDDDEPMLVDNDNKEKQVDTTDTQAVSQSSAIPAATIPASTPAQPSPREGWKVVDYLQFMDTGREPPPTASTT
ncbi:hypothetical protein CI109_105236 [Kwoniella shandongensis]|uniref:Uncharacterized protein n=1 Tax=Kwoniella shandongensis TaxID=1734106 RepID=A0A5M6C3M2_9TREE|nr:uncharacterized protein CI109_002080 [Kwoniella shandongensis]KAA5529654.1 hypothetical protein CI109_002080 [Kwoniella shandongensis]